MLCTLIMCPSLAMAPSTWICCECTLKDDGNKQGPCLICQAPHPKRRAVASVPAAAAAPPDNDNAKDNNNNHDDDNGNNDVDLPRDDNKVELPILDVLSLIMPGLLLVIVGANAESTMCAVVKFSMLT
jgi:hypothetical protein